MVTTESDILDKDVYRVDVGQYWWIVYAELKSKAKQVVLDNLKEFATQEYVDAVSLVAKVEHVGKIQAQFIEVTPDMDFDEYWEDTKEEHELNSIISKSYSLYGTTGDEDE